MMSGWQGNDPWEEDKTKKSAVRRILIGQVLLIICCLLVMLWNTSLHMTSTDSDEIFEELMITAFIFGLIGGFVSIFGIKAGLLGKSTVREKGYSRETLTLFVVIIAAYFVMMIVANFVLKKSTPISFLLTLAWAGAEAFDISALSRVEAVSDQAYKLLMILTAVIFVLGFVSWFLFLWIDGVDVFFLTFIPPVSKIIGMIAVMAACVKS